MCPVNSEIFPTMALPRAAKTPATATTTRAAATAYSESSSPVSSNMNLVIMSFPPQVQKFGIKPAALSFRSLFSGADMGTQLVNFVANGGAQRRECSNDGDSNQSRRHGIFGKFQSSFVIEEFFNHDFASSPPVGSKACGALRHF